MKNTLTILLGFGGSGSKTIVELAQLITNDPEAARFAKERLHVVICDTDEGELTQNAERIHEAFRDRCPGLDLPVEQFSLSTNVDVFCDLVQARLNDHREEDLARMRQHWWYRGDVPFSATGLPLSASAGAGQCPLVSHFLAWDKLNEFPRVLEKIDQYARNVRHMEDFSIDLVMVAGLAGGTGRGCWQLLSLKAREHFGRLGQACRPFGFFFDQSVFVEVKEGSPEQTLKLQVNSLTGLSELAMWLRSDRRMPGDPEGGPRERRFAIPSFASPANRQIDLLDTDRYMPETELARVGRSPIHKAYVFTNSSSSMELQSATQAYRVVAAAIFGRIMVSQLRSSDANQPARAATTATSVLYVPASDIRKVILNKAKIEQARLLLHGLDEKGEVLSRVDPTAVIFADMKGKHALAVDRLEQWFSTFLRIPSLADLQRTSRQLLSADPSIASRFVSDADDQSFNELRQEFRNGADRAKLEEDLNAATAGQPAEAANRYRSAFCEALGIEGEEARKIVQDAQVEAMRDHLLGRLWKPASSTVDADLIGSIHSLVRDAESSVGIAHAAIIGLHQAVSRLIEQVAQELQAIDPSYQGGEGASRPRTRVQILQEYDRARRRWASFPLSMVFAKVSRTNLASLVDMARDVRASEDLREVLKSHQRLLTSLHEALRQWRENSTTVVQTVNSVVRSMSRRHEESLKEYFTPSVDLPGGAGHDVATRALDALKRDDGNPVSRMVRMLRPVYDRTEFEQCVRETLAERRTGDRMRSELVEGLMKLDFQAPETLCRIEERRTSERLLFGRNLESRLRDILARQEAPESTLQKFRLPEVFARLVEHWADLYRKNKGDLRFARELNEQVFKACGISFTEIEEEQRRRIEEGLEADGEALPLPGQEELMGRLALKLADKCDPLVRGVDERTRLGDLVRVFLPDLSNGTARRPHEAWKAFIEREWRNAPDKFRHVHSDLFQGNPFMLVATSDHPKKDFEQRGWSGWTSFDYWSAPGVHKWLQWCEDPKGESVFLEGVDDSIGLGYVHPAFVNDPHWERRRWRPWVDTSRLKSQDRRKWEALAYALIGNEMYATSDRTVAGTEPVFLVAYREFLEKWKALGPVNGSFPGESWSLPLLFEKARDSKGPRFTRRLFARTNDGVRQLGTDATSLEWSMLGFVEWFESDASRDVLNAVWNEQGVFADVLKAKDEHFHDVLSRGHREAIRQTLLEYVRRWQEHVADPKTNRREDDRARQAKFFEDFIRVLDDRGFDVLRSFGLTSTHD